MNVTKRLLPLICVSLSCVCNIKAQPDNLQQTVASPYDNWFVGGNVGLQTYIGNESLKAACWNKPNFNLSVEGGYWITPSIGVGIQFSYFTISSQSCTEKNPYIDLCSSPYNKNGYIDFNLNAFSLGAVALVEWTNLARGYHFGQYRKLHFSTPVGLGLAYSFGKKVSQYSSLSPFAFSPYFSVGFQGSYHVNTHLELDATLNCAVVSHRFDYSPLSKDNGIFDWMPALSVGVRYNLFQEIGGISLSSDPSPEEQSRLRWEIIENSSTPKKVSADDTLFSLLESLAAQSPDSSLILSFNTGRFTLDMNNRTKLVQFVAVPEDGDLEMYESSEVKYVIITACTTKDSPNTSINRCNNILNTLIQNGLVEREAFATCPLGVSTSEKANSAYILPVSDRLMTLLSHWKEQHR